ncbi:MAG: ABC transporter ATP-binding protein [Candidatus Kariarchaeaceae archaeon]
MADKNLDHVLVCKDITKSYGEHQVLRGIDFTLQKYESVCFLGASGSGKTTLLAILSGLLPPTSGTVKISNQSLYSGNELLANRIDLVGMIFQHFALLNHLTVIENLIAARWFKDPNLKSSSERANQLLKSMDLQSHANKFPNQLSSGEQQRIAISRSLINDPKILFADEPTGSLDTQNSAKIMEIFMSKVSENRSLIFTTHNIQIAKYASRILMIQDGLLQEVEKSMLDETKSILQLYGLENQV